MKLKKFLSIIASLSLLFTTSGFLFKNEAFAQDAGTKTENVEVVCQKLARNNRNELEIPLGKAVDQAEYLADQVIAQSQVIIATAQQQIDAANSLGGLANQCGHEYCRPVCEAEERCNGCNCAGCDNTTQTRCPLGDCTSEIIPTNTCCCPGTSCFAGCAIPTGACNAGQENRPSACASECQRCSGRSHCCCTTTSVCTAHSCENSAGAGVYRACAPGIPAAASTVNTLYLAIVSTHDRLVHYNGYYASDVIPFLREAKPKLENCKPPTTDSDFEAVMKGEKQGEWLYSCTQIINMTELGVPIHSYLPVWNDGEVEFPDEPERGCYGNDYCKHLESIGENLPYGQPSCAEDYYCCIIGK